MRVVDGGPTGHEQGAGGAYAALLLMVGIWAVNFSMAKLALATVPPLAFNALRFPFAALVVLAALAWGGRIPLPARADVPRVVLLGLAGNVVYQMCFILGLDNTRAGTASVLLAGTPILTALLSSVIGHERVTGRMWWGVGLTFGGIVMVVAAGQGLGGGTLKGDLLMLGASCAWSAYTVGSRDLVARYGSVPVTAWTLWIGTAGLVALGVPEVLRLEPGTLTPAIWGAIVYAGALSVGMAYLIWYAAVRRIGNTRTAVFSNLTPAVALLVAWLWLGEVPAAGQVAGAAVIIAGITLVSRARPQPGRGPAGSVWVGGARPADGADAPGTAGPHRA
jgi:drug/metabolite transporter (DMT)-like permease